MPRHVSRASELLHTLQDIEDNLVGNDWIQETGENPREIMARASRRLESELDKVFRRTGSSVAEHR